MILKVKEVGVLLLLVLFFSACYQTDTSMKATYCNPLDLNYPGENNERQSEGAWMKIKITGKDSLKYFDAFQMAGLKQKLRKMVIIIKIR